MSQTAKVPDEMMEYSEKIVNEDVLREPVADAVGEVIDELIDEKVPDGELSKEELNDIRMCAFNMVRDVGSNVFADEDIEEQLDN